MKVLDDAGVDDIRQRRLHASASAAVSAGVLSSGVPAMLAELGHTKC